MLVSSNQHKQGNKSVYLTLYRVCTPFQTAR